ncbi:GDYXXLXY domain-containing protein [Ideonella sp.]|jgi:uncharacterized membrane-anchored protein|uniref:GDYXXLXY domain-containing protein n=1 Tax=Ideonella sp. TaxID=1929293 RepID=UPI0037BF21CF
MSTDRLQSAIAAAQAQGLLPDTIEPINTDSRPWPVVLLTALGAWLAAVPLLIVVGFLLEDAFRHSSSAGLMGALLTAGSVVVLRSKAVPLFVEQLAIPGLMTGMGLIAWMLGDGLRAQGAATALCPLLLALSAMLPQTWLRALLGAAAAAAGGFALVGQFGWEHGRASVSPWLTLHLLLAAVLALAAALLHRPPAGSQARAAAWAESVASGWLLATLLGLAWWAGMTFLVGASLGSGAAQDLAGEAQGLHEPWLRMGVSNAVSAALALLGGAWLSTRWPALRQAWCGGVVLVLTALAGLMPTLGACLLVLALCVGSQRWRMAAAAAVAAVWIIGAFYYALSWPLATKAAALVVAAAVLAGLAVWGLRSQRANVAPAPEAAAASPAQRTPRAHWGIALSLLLTLVAANGSIWQKEQLIRHGQAVFVPLAPVDPRSLMQGDYMTLNFMPRFTANAPELDMDSEAFNFEHPRMRFKRDAQGILSAIGPDLGQPLAADEVAIQLVPKNGRWIVVTDAFYFKEGEAQRWEAARFGEFRVDASGKALLVGLRGEGLKPL